MKYLYDIPIEKLAMYVDNDISVVEQFFPALKSKYGLMVAVLKPSDFDYHRIVELVKKNRPELCRVVKKRWLMREIEIIKVLIK